MMNGLKKLDEVIGAMKAVSNGGLPPAERREPRTRVKPSSRDGDTLLYTAVDFGVKLHYAGAWGRCN